MLALAHTVPQIVGSLPNSAIRLCFVDTLIKARCLRRMSQKRLPDPTQDSLLSVGQTLSDGLLPARIPTRDFRYLFHNFLPDLLDASWATTSASGHNT
jgi:hypothetical protein